MRLLCYVKQQEAQVNNLLAQKAALDKEKRDNKSCGDSVWVKEPVCYIIDCTMKIYEPIPCRGYLGCWRVGIPKKAAAAAETSRSARNQTVATYTEAV